jgi:hypothetical protein
MEILNMTFPGIPVGTLILIVGVGYIARTAWKEWRQDRENIKALKALKAAREEFNAKYEWKPRMVNGVDCGDWVRKDGRARGIDDD